MGAQAGLAEHLQGVTARDANEYSPSVIGPGEESTHLPAGFASSPLPAQGLGDVADGESESSSSSYSEAEVDEEHFHDEQSVTGQFPIEPAVPGHLFQNKKSRMLHRVGKHDNGHLLCGIRVTGAFTELPKGSKFSWSRCSRCFKGELLENPDQTARALSQLERARKERKAVRNDRELEAHAQLEDDE